MKIQLIASDLDGTLLTSSKEISPYTRKILDKAIQLGVQFVPATGRAFDSIPEFIRNYPGVEYIITSNGAALYSVTQKKRIYEKLLSPSSVDAILKISLSDTTTLETFINGKPYASFEQVETPERFGATDYGIHYVKKTRTPVSDILAFIQKEKHHLDSISISFGNQAEMPEIHRQLLATVPDIFVTTSIGHMLEVGHKDAGKDQTLLYLLDLLQISPEHAAAFGDAGNDLNMLKAVKYGYIMQNAPVEAKLPELRVAGKNDDDGLARALDALLK